MLDEYSGNYGHEDEPYQISSRWPGDFAKPACETGEDWQSGSAYQKVNEKADGSVFPAEHIDAD